MNRRFGRERESKREVLGSSWRGVQRDRRQDLIGSAVDRKREKCLGWFYADVEVVSVYEKSGALWWGGECMQRRQMDVQAQLHTYDIRQQRGSV